MAVDNLRVAHPMGTEVLFPWPHATASNADAMPFSSVPLVP